MYIFLTVIISKASSVSHLGVFSELENWAVQNYNIHHWSSTCIIKYFTSMLNKLENTLNCISKILCNENINSQLISFVQVRLASIHCGFCLTHKENRLPLTETIYKDWFCVYLYTSIKFFFSNFVEWVYNKFHKNWCSVKMMELQKTWPCCSSTPSRNFLKN